MIAFIFDKLGKLWELLAAPWLEPIWKSLGWMQFLFVLCLTLLVVCLWWCSKTSIANVWPERIAHDRAEFARLDAILNEQQLRNLDYMLGTDCSADSRSLDRLDEYLKVFGQASNAFLGWRIRGPHAKFHSAVAKLRQFIGMKFFHENTARERENQRYFMMPDLKNSHEDQKRAAYEACMKELDELRRAVMSSYVKFRNVIKTTLRV